MQKKERIANATRCINSMANICSVSKKKNVLYRTEMQKKEGKTCRPFCCCWCGSVIRHVCDCVQKDIQWMDLFEIRVQLLATQFSDLVGGFWCCGLKHALTIFIALAMTSLCSFELNDFRIKSHIFFVTIFFCVAFRRDIFCCSF